MQLIAAPVSKVTTNQKISCAMHRARIGLFHGDVELVKASLDLAKELIEKGGDWDKRNRYTVYEGMYCQSGLLVDLRSRPI